MEKKSKFRVLSPDEALTVIQLGRELHEGKRLLPPEIIKKKQEIAAATRNAERFILLFRVVDHSMIDDVVQLKLELDGLYAAWAVSETKAHPLH